MLAPFDALRETVSAGSQAGLPECREGIRYRKVTCMRYGHGAYLAGCTCPLHSGHSAVAPNTPVRTLVGHQAMGATWEISDRIRPYSRRATSPCEAEPLASMWGNFPT